MHEYNGKHAQIKILPRYKVKTEGESVQIYDQVIFESVKSPGQFFHASAPWKIDNFSVGLENRFFYKLVLLIKESFANYVHIE